MLAYDRLPLRNEAEEMESAKVDMAAARGGSLVHEFGHWMGLPHVFGDEDETDCDKGDGIEDTYLYSHDDRKWDCFQQVCGSSINLRVNYWMSVSCYFSECDIRAITESSYSTLSVEAPSRQTTYQSITVPSQKVKKQTCIPTT